MTDTLKQDIVDIVNYYDYRAQMFMEIEQALDLFENTDNEQRMWVHLFEYAMLKEATKEVLNAFSYDTLATLVGAFGVKLIIVGSPDE
jgi:hypothetical protein